MISTRCFLIVVIFAAGWLPISDAVGQYNLHAGASRSGAWTGPPRQQAYPSNNPSGYSQRVAMASRFQGNNKGNQAPKHDPPILNFDWARSKAQLPVHPQKPCNQCVRPQIPLIAPRLGELPGYRGRPIIPPEPGGCLCDESRFKHQHPMISQYWPRPFSAILDETCGPQSSCQPRWYDAFDSLKEFKLINYTRTDSGECGNNCFGRNRDPFGCLGESRFWASQPGCFSYDNVAQPRNHQGPQTGQQYALNVSQRMQQTKQPVAPNNSLAEFPHIARIRNFGKTKHRYPLGR